MSSPRTVVAVVAAVVALVGALAGCADEPAAAPLPTIGLGGEFGDEIDEGVSDAVVGRAADADRIDRVVMVGDSITKGATPALEEAFRTLGLEPTIAAENGKRMAVSSDGNPSGADVAAFLAAGPDRDPSREVWVVALGTNDAGQYSAPDELAAAINEVLGEVPDGAALVWVDTYIDNRTDDSGAVNAIVRERLDRRGNAVIAPWTSLAPADGVLSGDAVHPTDEGSDVFAAVVADTVRTFLGR